MSTDDRFDDKVTVRNPLLTICLLMVLKLATMESTWNVTPKRTRCS